MVVVKAIVVAAAVAAIKFAKACFPWTSFMFLFSFFFSCLGLWPPFYYGFEFLVVVFFFFIVLCVRALSVYVCVCVIFVRVYEKELVSEQYPLALL